MEDARGKLPPSADPRVARVGSPGRRSFAAAFAAALTAPRLHDSGSPLPGYGWILGAGLTCLGFAWLLSWLGGRRGRGVAPPVWGRRSDEMDLVSAVLGFHTVEAGAGPVGAPPRERIDPDVYPGRAREPRMSSPRARRSRRAPPRPMRLRPTAPAPTRPRLVHERLGFETRRRPSATTAWLHLVSGATPALTARAACTVAADLIERGGRVLLVDAGRRCLLHARFAREARWGLGECLDGSLPVLGVVQDTGHTGLHLLARGGEPSLAWPMLGRLVDEAHAHFEHVLVALDSDVPREAGRAIAGRLVEGWWAGERLPERTACALSERLGVVFSAMPLDQTSERLFESALGAPARVAGETAAMPGVAPAVEIVPVEIAAAAHATEPAAVNADTEAVAQADAEATILGCDGDVRARLEFLMWVRRMTGDAPARPPAWQLADAGVPV